VGFRPIVFSFVQLSSYHVLKNTLQEFAGICMLCLKNRSIVWKCNGSVFRHKKNQICYTFK